MKLFIFIFMFQSILEFQNSLVSSATLGQSCRIQDKDGTCVMIKNCPAAKLAFKRHNVPPQYCNKKERTICCANIEEESNRPVVNTISAQSELIWQNLWIEIEGQGERL